MPIWPSIKGFCEIAIDTFLIETSIRMVCFDGVSNIDTNYALSLDYYSSIDLTIEYHCLLINPPCTPHQNTSR